MRKMKDSGVEWIGEIPEEWTLNKIGALYDERNTKVSDKDYPPLSVTKNGIVPQLETAAKTDNGDNRKLIRKNDFVINSRSDRRGSCGISEFDGSCSLINTVLKPRKNMCNAYYSFVFRSELFADEFYRWGNGIVDDLWSTKWSSMKSIYIPSPTLEEQERIADYLDSKCSKIDAIIARQEEIIEKLKEYKLSVITEAVTKGLNPDAEMKDSGSIWFGRIPANWNMKRLKYQFHIQKDIAGKDGYTVLSITQRGIIPKDFSKNEGQFANSYANYQLVHIGDFAMNHMDLLTGWVDISKYEGVTSPDYRVFVLDDKENNCPEYYLYMMQMCYSQKIFYGLGAGVSGLGRWRLQADKFLNFWIPIPPKEEQEKIAAYISREIDRVDGFVEKREQIVAKLQEYKKSLIYEVVTGKKEV